MNALIEYVKVSILFQYKRPKKSVRAEYIALFKATYNLLNYRFLCVALFTNRNYEEILVWIKRYY